MRGITNSKPGEGIHVSLAEKKTKKLVCAICLCTLLRFVITITLWFCIILSLKIRPHNEILLYITGKARIQNTDRIRCRQRNGMQKSHALLAEYSANFGWQEAYSKHTVRHMLLVISSNEPKSNLTLKPTHGCLFTLAKVWKQLKCSLASELRDKQLYMQTMGYQSAPDRPSAIKPCEDRKET